jgi:hypothetical protein
MPSNDQKVTPMPDRRFNNTNSKHTSTSAPSGATMPPTALSVEERGVAALTDEALTTTALAALLEETNSAIAAAEWAAAAEKERAFDLALSHAEAKAAHDKMVDASFRADRLKTLAPRLERRLAEAVVREEAAAWIAERDVFAAAHLPAMAEQRDLYDAALQTIVGFFTRVGEFSAARGALLSRRPVHLGLENIADPVPAPSLLQNTRLFDFNGVQLWPNPAEANRFATEMSQSVLAMVTSGDRDATGPNWWRAVARRQVAAAEEAKHQGERFAKMKIAQEARENEEAAKNWNAAHGTR